MLSQRVGQLLRPYNFLSRLVIACGIGLLLGTAALALSPLLVLVSVIGILSLAAIAYRPELGVLAILVVTSGLVDPERLPLLSMGRISLNIGDLILLYLLALVVTKALLVPSFTLVRTPLDVPLIWFYLAFLLAAVLAITQSSVDMNFVLRRLRALTYWLVFFAVTNLVGTRSQLIRLFRGMIVIGLLLAVIMVIQASAGRSVSLMSDSFLTGTEPPIRIFHPGVMVIYILLITVVCDTALRRDYKYWLLRPVQILVLAAGLLVTVTRHLLVSATISLVVLIFVLRRFELSRLLRSLMVTAFIAIALASVLAVEGKASLMLEYSTAYLGRLGSMLSPAILTPQENLQWRLEEIRYAWPHTAGHPLLGIGLGTPYRPPFHQGETTRYYVHNAYVWIWLAAGLFGLAPFLWLSVCFLQRAFSYWRDIRDGYLRTLTLGFALAYLGLMISNLTSPWFLENWALASVGVILGINESILTHKRTADHYLQDGGSM